MRIRVASSIAEVEALRPLWMKAFSESPGTMFQRFEWNVLALRTFSDQAPVFIAAESDSSIAILPLVECKGTVTFAGSPLFDYRDAICAGDSSGFQAAIEKLSTLELPFKCEGIIGAASAARWSRLSPQAWTSAPFVSERQNSAETFCGKHGRSRRALRRLADLGAEVRKVQGSPEYVERIYREKAKEPAHWGTNVFRDERCMDFMRAVVGLPNTRCELFLLEVEQKPIAALVTFIDQRSRRFYTTWMDTSWSRHSPGIALLFEATCHTLGEGMDCDYMTGEQPYKLRFATGSEPLYRIEATAEELLHLRRGSRETVELKAA